MTVKEQGPSRIEDVPHGDIDDLIFDPDTGLVASER